MAILLIVKSIISSPLGNIFSWEFFRVYCLSVWFILSKPSYSSTSLSSWKLLCRREYRKLLMLIFFFFYQKWLFSSLQACTPCPAGYSCPDVSNAPTIDSVCQRGTYSFSGWPECIACPAGYACPSIFGKGIITCALGTYSLDMSTVSMDQLGSPLVILYAELLPKSNLVP